MLRAKIPARHNDAPTCLPVRCQTALASSRRALRRWLRRRLTPVSSRYMHKALKQALTRTRVTSGANTRAGCTSKAHLVFVTTSVDTTSVDTSMRAAISGFGKEAVRERCSIGIQAGTEHIEFDSGQRICAVRCMFAVKDLPGWPFVGMCRHNRHVFPDMSRIWTMVDA